MDHFDYTKSINSDFSALRYPSAKMVGIYQDAFEAARLGHITQSWTEWYRREYETLAFQRALGLAYSE